MKRKWAIILGIVISLVVVAGFVGGNTLYNIALNPRADKGLVFGTTQDPEAVSGSTDSDEGEVASWLAGVGYEDDYILAGDGLKLHAYVIEQSQPSDMWVIAVHGYTGEAMEMSPYAQRFYGRGYNILMPNLRSHGQSEGDYIGMGWHDRLDIIGWIDRILADNARANIVLFGVSMGGATVMMTAGEPLPDNVFAVIEDCGYTSAWAEFSTQMGDLFGLPDFPLMNFASLVAKIRAGYFIEEASAVNQLKKTKLPILFIHGEEDRFVPFWMLDEVYEAAAGEKEKYSVPGAAHAESAKVAGDAYWDRVFGFLVKQGGV